MQNRTDRFFSALVLAIAVAIFASQETSANRSVMRRQEIQKVQDVGPAANRSSEKIIVATGIKIVLLERGSKAILWESSGLRGAYCVAALPEGGFLVGEGTSIAKLDKDGRIVSRASATFGLITDVKSLPGARMLISDGRAGTVAEMDWLGNIVWSVSGLHWPSEAERLPNGNTLIADGTAQLKEFDSAGKLLSVIELQRWAASVQRVEGGTLVGEREAVELLDRTGSSIWSQAKSGRVTGVQRLPSGEYLISEPDAERIAILDAHGNVTWEATGLGHPWRAIYLR
jgi:hypothetical protein